MLALTIQQPWADCICYADKRIENRSWRPPKNVIGQRIAIHAGKSFDHTATAVMVDSGVLNRPEPFVYGAIVATVVIRGVVTESDSPWFSGPFGWELEDVQVLAEPIPCRGAQRLWRVPASASPSRP